MDSTLKASLKYITLWEGRNSRGVRASRGPNRANCAGSEESPLICLGNCLGTTGRPQLGEDVPDFSLDGSLAQVECPDHVWRTDTLGDQSQQSEFLVGQPGGSLCLDPAQCLELLHDFVDQRWADSPLTSVYGPNRICQNLGRGTFQQVAVHAGLGGLSQVYLVIVGGQDDHTRLG